MSVRREAGGGGWCVGCRLVLVHGLAIVARVFFEGWLRGEEGEEGRHVMQTIRWRTRRTLFHRHLPLFVLGVVFDFLLHLLLLPRTTSVPG